MNKSFLLNIQILLKNGSKCSLILLILQISEKKYLYLVNHPYCVFYEKTIIVTIFYYQLSDFERTEQVQVVGHPFPHELRY